MSRRTRLYRRYVMLTTGKADVERTTDNIRRSHRTAKDENGRICSLSINPDKAQRLAQKVCAPRTRQ